MGHSGPMTVRVRISDAAHEELLRRAQEQHRTVAAVIDVMLEEQAKAAELAEMAVAS